VRASTIGWVIAGGFEAAAFGVSMIKGMPTWVPYLFVSVGGLAALVGIYLWLRTNFRFVPPSVQRIKKTDSDAQTLVAEAELVKQRRLQGKQNQVLSGLRSATNDLKKKIPPTPIFGSPRQEAGQHYLSWWHIPITLYGGSDTPNGKIEHCTVHVLRSALPANMRWQSDDPRGDEEATLLEGRTRLVPIAIRCEINDEVDASFGYIKDGVGRLTSTAYLRDGNFNKFTIASDKSPYIFKLLIRSGSKEWLSPHSYILKIPVPTHSNGHFILEIWHQGRD